MIFKKFQDFHSPYEFSPLCLPIMNLVLGKTPIAYFAEFS
jgi:hypothetical protein